jgi:hypothetical protein
MATALSLCLMAYRIITSPVIARPIVGSIIAVIIGSDDPTWAINRARLVIIAHHTPLPINRAGVVSVVIAIAVRRDWCGIAIRAWSRIGLRRSPSDDGAGGQTHDTGRDCSSGSPPGTSLGIGCREAAEGQDACCGKNCDLTHLKSPEEFRV